MKIVLLLTSVLISVSIYSQIVSIPDINLKNALIAHSPIIDIDGDSEIQMSEAIAYTGSLKLFNKNISDANGIEAFINATQLELQNNNLNSIDLTQNTELTRLNVQSNNLTSLNVSQNTGLTHLYFRLNQLTTIDISSLVNLRTLSCSANDLTTLNTSNLSNLRIIDCGYNPITNIIGLNTNVNLTHLTTEYSQIANINTVALADLEYLVCSSSSLTTLDVTTNTSLLGLECANLGLNSLDISNCSDLKTLDASNNNIASLDFFNNTDVTDIDLVNNSIDSLDFSMLNSLVNLDLRNNNLEYLDLRNGNNLNIDEFSIGGNDGLFCVNVDDSIYSEDNWRFSITTVGDNTVFNGDCDASCHVPLVGVLDSITACSEYIFNGRTILNSGNYYYMTNTVSQSCKDSIVRVNVSLSIDSLVLNISQTNDTLEVLENDSISQYQWIDCSDNSIISGANTFDYITTGSGSYAVQLTSNNGCIKTSDCFTMSISSLDESQSNKTLVYPNPVNDLLNVNFNSSQDRVVLLYNTSGVLVEKFNTSNSKLLINMLGKPKGVYIISVVENEQVSSYKVIK